MGCVATSDCGQFSQVADLPPEEVIFGKSPAMGVIRKKVGMAANANVAVLLQGQSGTGKEVLAKLIHRRSPWGKGPFVKVNCPAIPVTLLESELFGYERGAFTGAYGTKPGRVELAHRGTLFLDEIAELDPALQAKLLQLLQNGQFCRIGAQGDKRVEVRVVCATNRQLQREIKSGTFRQDLFYRINALTMQLPPLRERRADIPILVKYFLETYSRKFNYPVRPPSNGLLDRLQKYQWPGNIRELENLIQNYVILGCEEEEILNALQNGDQDPLNLEISQDAVIPLRRVVRQAVKQLERKIILSVLEANHWNRKVTARALTIGYSTLLNKMREAGIPPIRGPRAHQQVTVHSGDAVN